MEKVIATIVIATTSLFTLVGIAGVIGNDEYKCPDKTIIVAYGDTLWSLAERHCTGNLVSAVDSLVDKHSTTHLQVGDIVYLGKGDTP
jgi:hypothetical protein